MRALEMLMGVQLYLLTAAICDKRFRKIPNDLVLLGMVAALGAVWITGGVMSLFTALGRGVLFMLVTYPLFLTGTIGAGDVKLFSVVGALLDPGMFFVWVFFAFLVGGIISLMRLLSMGGLGRGLLAAAGHIMQMKRDKRFVSYRSIFGKEGQIPFGICMFAGFVLVSGKEIAGCIV